MSKQHERERHPLNDVARATHHVAPDVTSAFRDTWIRVPVPDGTTRVHALVEGDGFAAGCRLEHVNVKGVTTLVAAVKIGGVRASHVAVLAWSEKQ